MTGPHPPHSLTYRRLIAALPAALLWLIAASPVFGADPVPSGAREALAPVTRMIPTLVAIAIGLGIAICTAVMVWGGIEKMLAGANSESEHRARRPLPRSLDDLRGLRAARWVRESTDEQFDRYGPDSQREQMDRFTQRFGLVDTGLSWEVPESGRTVWRHPKMAEMLAAARAVRFDVLLTGYADRWQRNLRRFLELIEDALHPARGGPRHVRPALAFKRPPRLGRDGA